MKTIDFQIIVPMCAAKEHNSRPTHFGDLKITGVGHEDKANTNEPYRVDITSVLFNGAEVKDLFDYLFHGTLDGADLVENASLAHVIYLFGKDPADYMNSPKASTLRGATDIYSTLRVFDPNMQIPGSFLDKVRA